MNNTDLSCLIGLRENIIVLFDDFGELVSIAPFEVLKRAIEEGAPFTVEFVSSEQKQEVTTSFGVTVQSHDFLRMDNRPDMFIFYV